MYTREEKIKAVNLLIKYERSYAQVIRELGYPSKTCLNNWYKDYQEKKKIPVKYVRKSKYTDKDKRKVVKHYLENGRSISRTIRALGYPSRPMLYKWLDEFVLDEKKHCLARGSLVKYSQEDKRQAVVSLVSKEKSSKEISREYGVTQGCIHNWKRQLLKEGIPEPMNKKTKKTVNHSELETENKELQAEVAKLQKQVYKLQLEHDVLEKAVEVIKKEKGVSLQTLTNREKAIVINALRDKYSLKDLLEILSMAKSSYCYQVVALEQEDKYADLRKLVVEEFNNSYRAYGYRRIHLQIKAAGNIVSEKVIRRIMREEKLVASGRSRRNYSSYKGEISPAVENLINRDFHADTINQKWLTDITEFHIPAGKVYLSPIIDCFDELPVTWSMSTSPNAELANSMLDSAIATLKDDEHPIIHSDRGSHYRWPGWIERMNQAKLIRSMSRKGCTPDNAACEGFFGRVKNEFFYSRSWRGVSIQEFFYELDRYLCWYAEERIKISLGGMSPLNYRRSLGLIN